MNLLIIGSGGRESALYLKLRESHQISNLWILPGNGDLENRIEGIDINDFDAISNVIKEKSIDNVVIGPEAPLVAGIREYLQKENPSISVFGPNSKGAMLEGSKAFSYEVMNRLNIPTAKSIIIDNLEEAKEYIEKMPLPIVLKVDGLAAGKGVSIHQDRKSAKERAEKIIKDKIFGEAGRKILLQEFMTGQEASLFAVCNGEKAVYLPTARDYKPAYENNEGPNTGGMGSLSPGDTLNDDQIAYCDRMIVQKIIDEFNYTGILYVGLMVHSEKADDISVVEFNCRLGDPETQSVLPMIDTDFLPYILWASGEKEYPPLVEKKGYYTMPQKPGAGVNVVVAAKGYPASYTKGIDIYFPQKTPKDVHIVPAGLEKQKDGSLKSKGGRIFNIFGHGASIEEASKKVYDFIEDLKKINFFEKLHYRKDIGK